MITVIVWVELKKKLFVDIEYLKQTLPSNIEEEFYEFLSSVSAKDVTLYAIAEGSVAFPR